MLQGGGEALGAIHDRQVRREPWPEFASFQTASHPHQRRRTAASDWLHRATAEYSSVQQFATMARALTELRAPVPMLGAIARLITDEVRHAELCLAVACTLEPDADHANRFDWPNQPLPWCEPPLLDVDKLAEWTAEAVMGACCIGETLSVPMLEAIRVVATEPFVEAVATQILKDEHLHARFGWETLAWLMRTFAAVTAPALTPQLSVLLTAAESSTTNRVSLASLAGQPPVVIGPSDSPNLGTLSDREYAAIFYATVETDILPSFSDHGFDSLAAWHQRPPLSEFP